MKAISWLLEGDISIQYMTHRDLIGSDGITLSQMQKRIPKEGFGAKFLSRQNESGHWGSYYYQPKWTSTHYTLLDIKNICAPETLKPCREMISRMFDECMNEAGGMNLSKYNHPSDICVDGMILNYASYFCKEESRLVRLVNHLLSVQKKDGGFTWDMNSDKSDPHTTICVLEGFAQFQASGLQHRRWDIEAAKTDAAEFLLRNRLFFDDVDKRFRKLSYPYRYRYDLLRAMEYFARQNNPFDTRMWPAMNWLQEKKQRDGLWYLENEHKGKAHFTMEEIRSPSRFVTLRALYILVFPEQARTRAWTPLLAGFLV